MNFRRIFEERNYDIRGHVLSLAETRLFSDLPTDAAVSEAQQAHLIRQAEELLGKEIPQLTATDYMIYRRQGNRTVFGDKYYRRRTNLMTLMYAEYFEGKGRFTDALIDLLWAILEETSWVIPAHNVGSDGKAECLPHAFGATADYIDLHSAMTAADVAFVYRFLKGPLDAVTPLVCERMLYELYRRVVRPFLDPQILRTKLKWTGILSGHANNWCPWIISNILTVCACAVEDMQDREAIVAQSMDLLNNLTASYHDDGGCDEGASYWASACGGLYDCCCLLYDLTEGYVDMFDDPLLRRMGEYKPAIYITDGNFLNFADAPSRIDPTAALVLDWGRRVGSDAMISYGACLLEGNTPDLGLPLFRVPYRSLRLGCLSAVPARVFTPLPKAYFDGVQVAITRQSDGMYLAVKGGHNGESHNHCDVGTVTVYAHGKPLFVDAGVGEYTSRSFGSQRYTIWSNRSDYHNTVSVNNCVQSVGKDACAENVIYDESTGKLTLDLTKVYPKEANLASYVRSAVLEEGVITLTDTVAFDGEGVADFHFLVTEPPADVQKGSLRIGGCTVTFDESLTVQAHRCDHALPETAKIAPRFGVDALYRITLHSPPFTCRTFTLTVHP